jgi:integrase
MKVHLRKRKQTQYGKVSLYLEIYKGTITTPEGKTKILRDYEYLEPYLIDNPKTPLEKQHNKEHWKLAENIKAKRELEIASGNYGFTNSFKVKTNFVAYFREQAEKRKQSEGNFGNWDSALKHFINFAGEQLTFKEIDASLCESFKSYLETKAKKSNKEKLSSSSAASYFTKFKACLRRAVKDKIILSNPCDDVSTPKIIEKQREYLTLDEVKAVAKAECRYDVLKRAFLFSCLTGLRWSDINNLEWSQVQDEKDGSRITFHQQKTKGLQYLHISAQARKYLGECGNPKVRVFTGLKYSSYMNVELQKWMMRAGITKDITFHCARHTFAVLQLTKGTSIYTLSKLLGHSELKTTQVYAKVEDVTIKEAVNRIPDISI